MNGPGPLRDKDADVIKSGALGITWMSGGVASAAAILTVLNEDLINFFGDKLADDLKAGILVVVILAWTLIAITDVMARAKVTAARISSGVATAPQDMKVKVTGDAGTDDGWSVAAIRGNELLVARSGMKPKWVKQSEVTLE